MKPGRVMECIRCSSLASANQASSIIVMAPPTSGTEFVVLSMHKPNTRVRLPIVTLLRYLILLKTINIPDIPLGSKVNFRF